MADRMKHSQELPRFLTEEYGIEPKYIDVKTK